MAVPSRLLHLMILALLSVACGGSGSDASSGRALGDPLPEGAQAVSLLGEPLITADLPADTRATYEAALEEARAALAADSTSADAWIWAGRRTAYLGDFREAIRIYTEGIRRFPEDARFYRHRGHRYISVRELDNAVADLLRAAELQRGRQDQVEPDGLPNARNTPTSTLQGNIWYHLGLAYYLQGRFGEALDAYRDGIRVATTPDMRVAFSHWLYMTLRRVGREEEAARVLEPIHAGMDIIENQAYHRLLLMYRGELTPEELLGPDDGTASLESTTTAYGVGTWYLYNGDPDRALEVYRRIVSAGDQWPAFGYVAAEADLRRLDAGSSAPD